DCKSVALAASKVRVLPSPPSFARFASFGGQAIRNEGDAVMKSGLGWQSGHYGAQRREKRACPPKCEGGSNSVVESQPSKLLVAGSIPVSRSNLRSRLSTANVSFGWQATRRLSTVAREASEDGLASQITADLSPEAPQARRPM